MPVYSGSVERLIEKARFEPDVAMAVAGAIEMAITDADLVTRQMLDARVAEIRADMHEIKAELIRWVFLVMLGNVALGAGATAILNALQHVH